MMHGPEKSDPIIVARKPTNEAGRPVEEPVERRVGAKGNADQQSTHRTQRRVSVTQALDRIRKVASESERLAVTHPRWEPYAGKPPVRFCAVGAMQIASLPLPVLRLLHLLRSPHGRFCCKRPPIGASGIGVRTS